jgi:outer membrane receptor protein involved in Fe transport
MGLKYTWTRAKIEEGSFEGKTIPDVPEHSGVADLSYDFGFGLRIGLNGQYMGKRYFVADFNNSLEEQDDYFLLNGKVKYVWRMLTFYLDLNNMLDETYSAYGVKEIDPSSTPDEQKAFYPSPGFNWLAGVKIEY